MYYWHDNDSRYNFPKIPEIKILDGNKNKTKKRQPASLLDRYKK